MKGITSAALSLVFIFFAGFSLWTRGDLMSPLGTEAGAGYQVETPEDLESVFAFLANPNAQQVMQGGSAPSVVLLHASSEQKTPIEHTSVTIRVSGTIHMEDSVKQNNVVQQSSSMDMNIDMTAGCTGRRKGSFTEY